MTTKLFPLLGIADIVAKKTTNAGAEAVAKGEADISIRPASELVRVQGLDYVGQVPREIQYISVFSAAIVSGSAHAEAARKLIAFLASDAAMPAITNSGMERVKRR